MENIENNLFEDKEKNFSEEDFWSSENDKYNDYIGAEEIIKDNLDCNQNCEKSVDVKAKVGVPIKIKPFAKTGKIKAKCLNPRFSEPNCSCEAHDECNYTITVDVQFKIPIIIGAKAETGKLFVKCFKPHCRNSDNDISVSSEDE